MPEDKLPISEFAKRIKQKYPVYNDMNDTTLVENVLAKYPQYADMVDVSGLSKKKDSTSVAPTTTEEPKPSSTSLPPKEETPGTPASKPQESPLKVNGLTVPQGMDLHSFSKLMGSAKPDYGQIDIDANKKINDMTGAQNEDPLSHIYGSVMAPGATTHDKAVATRAAKIIRDKMLPDGYEAKKVLATTHFGDKGVSNLTATEVRNKAELYDKTTAPLRELPVPDRPYDDNVNVKQAYMDLLTNAAIKWRASNDAGFKKQLGNANVDLKDPDLKLRIDANQRGQTLQMYLNNKDVMTYVQKENPKLTAAYVFAAKQNPVQNVEYGINAVATEVSQGIQKSGYNMIEPIFNFDTPEERKYANTIAEGLYQNDPDKLAIYNKYIRDNQAKYLDKPSLVERAEGSMEDIFKGIKNSLTSPFTSREEKQRERWEEEAKTVNADPKGMMAFISNTGKATGFVLGLAAGGEVGEGLGLSEKVAQRGMAALTFFGNELGNSEDKYKNPLLAFTDASIKTGMFAWMSDIFPAAKAKAAFGEIRPEMETVIENLTSGKITQAAARKEFHGLAEKAFEFLYYKSPEFIAKAAVQNTKMSLEMTGITATDQMLDKVFGLNDQQFNRDHPSGELMNTFTSMFTSNGIVSGMAARGEMRRANKVFDNGVYRAASNPLQTWRAIENLGVKDPSTNVSEMFDNLTFLANTKTDLDNIKNKKGQPLTEKEKSDYLSAALKEKVMQQKADKTTDETLKKASSEDLKYQKDVKENILKGEPGHPTVESAVIEIGGKTFEGKNHAEALLKAQAAGEDITKIDRQAEGKFKLSDGTIIDRAEAMNRFGRDHSEQLIPQDDAAKAADEELKKSGQPAVVEKTPEELLTEKGAPIFNVRLPDGTTSDLIKTGQMSAEEGVLELAKQRQGISDSGEDLGEGQPRTAFNKFDQELMDAVDKKFPDKKSVIDAIKKPEAATTEVNENGEFNVKFSDGARAFGKINGEEANIVGINAAKKEGSVVEPQRGTDVFGRLIKELSGKGVKTIKISNQSQDSRIALQKLVEKGVLINPRENTGLSVDEHPTKFDIAPTTEVKEPAKTEPLKSNLESDNDLKGEPKKPWMVPVADGDGERITKLRKQLIKLASGELGGDNKYLEAINEDKMSAGDAKLILESAGVKVPKEISDLIEKEKSNKEDTDVYMTYIGQKTGVNLTKELEYSQKKADKIERDIEDSKKYLQEQKDLLALEKAKIKVNPTMSTELRDEYAKNVKDSNDFIKEATGRLKEEQDRIKTYEGYIADEQKRKTDETKKTTPAAVEPVKAEEKGGAAKEPDKTVETTKAEPEKKSLEGQQVELNAFGANIKGTVTKDDGSGVVTVKKEGTDFELTVDKESVKPIEAKAPATEAQKPPTQKTTKPETKSKAKIFERPEMESPVYEVKSGDKSFYIQRIEGMNPGDTAWHQVIKRPDGTWAGPKGDVGVMMSGFLGYTKAEAIDMVLRHEPEPETKTGDTNQPVETKQPQDADGPTPQPKDKVEEFNKNVDEVASAVKDWMKKVKLISDLPEGTQKSGLGLEDIVDAAAGIVKQAYVLGNDIKLAVEKAIQHVSDRWNEKEWGNFDDFEKQFRQQFSRINPNVGKEMTKQEIQQLLDASRANNPKFLERAKEYAKGSPVGRLAVATVKTFDPFVGGSKSTPSIYNDARLTAVLLRKSLGKMQHENEVASDQTEKLTRFFEGMDEADRVMFITNIERGIDMKDPKLNEIAKMYRDRMEKVFAAITSIKDIAPTYIEDYFPHFWADPEAAKRVFAKSMAKTPIEGTKGMLRARFYSDIIEGMKDGLKLVSTNPEDLVRLAEINAYKFTMAHDFFNALKGHELTKFYAAGTQPEGWSLIDDPLFKRVIPTEKGTILTGGWYMPNEAAEIVKRYSSRGLKGPLVDTIRGFNNFLNQAQLGISFFHGMTTTIDAAVTSNALGIDKILRGKIGTGLWDLGSGVTVIPNLIRQMYVGGKAIKDFRSGVINKNVETMMAANARTGVDVIYRTDMANRFMRDMAGHQYGKALLKSVPALFDMVAKPIFEHLVPRLKVGGLIRVAENELSKLKNPSQDQIDRTIQKAWDDMENRLGQMTYDNLFWKKTTKDIAFGITRSVGWNLGTIRAFAEGTADLPKSLVTGVTGKGISPRTAWMMALVGQTALMGAMTTYIMTGERPKDWRDYFYPRTGGKDKNGNDKRIQFPTYMRDVFNTKQRGIGHELAAKAAPWIGMGSELWNDKDFYGNMIRNPLDPAYEQGKQLLEYGAEQLLPFAFRSQPGEQPTPIERGLKGIGITPAPQYVVKGVDRSKIFERYRDAQMVERDIRKQYKQGTMKLAEYNTKLAEVLQIESEARAQLNEDITPKSVKNEGNY